jgi:glycoprotein 2-beta-D-xylosyltransferase
MERPTFHYIQDVLSAVTLEQRQLPCGETWTGTTLFLTRYEYVNLYHTMTDFFNTFLSYPIVDHDNEQQVNVVFLDGHAKGNLDSVWRQVFGKTAYVKHLPEGGVCFNRVVFIPPGYVAPFYPKTFRSVCPNPIMMEDFANHFLTSFNLDHVQMQRGKIVIIDRVPYISHPRSKPHRAERTVNNMNELPARLRKLPNVESVSVVHFEELTFKQQLKAVREAHILIGNHGAGLTHMVFMSDGSHVVEFDGRQPFFTALSGWKPHVGHHVIRSVSGHLSEEYIQRILIPTLEKILR